MSEPEDEEGYSGPLTLVAGESSVAVEAHVAGHFDPLTGTYRWVCRLAPDDAVTRVFKSGETSVELRAPSGHVGTGTLGAPNLWGGHTVSGTGPPPFALPEVSPEE